MPTKRTFFVSLLLLGLTEQSGFARTTVLLTGVQSNGVASDRIEQAIVMRLKRLGDTVIVTPRYPIGSEYVGCDESRCFEPIASRETADYFISGRVTSSEHARLARIAIYSTARKEVIAEEVGCEDCHEKAIVDQAASLATSLLDKAVSLPAPTPTTRAIPAATALVASPSSDGLCPACPVCASCPVATGREGFLPLPTWRRALAGVLGVVAGGAFSIAVTATWANGKVSSDLTGHYNGKAVMGAFYPITAAALIGLTLTLKLP